MKYWNINSTMFKFKKSESCLQIILKSPVQLSAEVQGVKKALWSSFE